MIKILIIEDHRILIQGIKELIKSEDNCEIVYEAYDGGSGIEIVSSHNDIDVVLLDINLPDMSGIEVCQKIKTSHPTLPILALTMHESITILRKMINAGANGYVLKDTSKKELISAIKTVLAGEMYLSPKIKQIMTLNNQDYTLSEATKKPTKLTMREKEVLKLILMEHTTEEMADKLGLSKHTILSHRKNLLKKLGARNTAGIVKQAYEQDLFKN